jgi:AraC family transcriptional activator FtrA
VLFVEDGTVLTAAGSAAALDLGLHLIHHDHGAEIANAVSRRLVFAGHRAASPATLHRRFRAELGTTPLAWLTAERVTLACRLIEHGDLALDRVASASGLGSGASLRAQLRRHTGLTPSAYRARFGTGSRPGPDPVPSC